ncbi:MAG: hypothetical protein JEZ07_01845 [Phycisphaerae bacterium]|nr:hypothetical protein [Phycisphaerae bacterium]
MENEICDERWLEERAIRGFSIGYHQIPMGKQKLAFQLGFAHGYKAFLNRSINDWQADDIRSIVNMKDALAVAREVLKISANIEEKDLVQNFDFVSAQYLCILLEGNLDRELFGIYDKETFEGPLPEYVDIYTWFRAADYSIISALVKQKVSQPLLKRLKVKDKLYNYYIRIYTKYSEIIQAWLEEDWDACVEHANEAAFMVDKIPKKLHSEIFEDSHYGFTDKVLDYKLAAILKYCLSDKPEILEKIDIKHKWPWSQADVDKQCPPPLMERIVSAEELGLINNKPWWKFW